MVAAVSTITRKPSEGVRSIEKGISMRNSPDSAAARSKAQRSGRPRRRQPGRIVDLFAGAGGWAQGLHELGLASIGVENDSSACATARAAGHECLQADVTELDPVELAPAWGLVGSPPCQAYSYAGKGLGKLDKPIVIACAHELAAGNDSRAAWLQGCRDSRSLLTVEPLRYAIALKPRWVALEQVPAVLELWSIFASLLALHGYHTVAGVLSAEQFGVPQTRKRAFLLASLDGPIKLPDPTHRSYNSRRAGIAAGEESLLPWISMAQALGWAGEHAVGYPRRNRRRRPVCQPSATLTSKARSWTRVPCAPVDHGEREITESPQAAQPPRNAGRWAWRNGNQAHSSLRVSEDPAPTIHFDHRANKVEWVPCHYEPRQRGAKPRPLSKPAPTMLAAGLSKGTPVWAGRRPATTVTCDQRVHPPGHKHNSSDPPGRYQERSGPHAVRVTVQQAALLQGFPADYPWQGTRTAQFTQIGNALPPPLAESVVAETIRPSLPKRPSSAKKRP